MSATLPADVFTSDAPVWISEGPSGHSLTRFGCYIGVNRATEFDPFPETVHECDGNDWTCPVGVALDLAYGEHEMSAGPEVEEDDDPTCSDPDCLCD